MSTVAMTSGLAQNQINIWWITLGLGLVVVIVVILLLSLLTGIVRDIDRNVAQTWQTATGVARNTTTTWMLGQTAELSDALGDEVAAHAALFPANNGRARTKESRR